MDFGLELEVEKREEILTECGLKVGELKDGEEKSVGGESGKENNIQALDMDDGKECGAAPEDHHEVENHPPEEMTEVALVPVEDFESQPDYEVFTTTSEPVRYSQSELHRDSLQGPAPEPLTDCQSVTSEWQWLVSVDRKISVFDWFLLVTGPLVNPILGIFVILFAVKMRLAKKAGDSKKALRWKALMLGLTQWCWRLSITVLVFFAVLYTMFQTGRFAGKKPA